MIGQYRRLVSCSLANGDEMPGRPYWERKVLSLLLSFFARHDPGISALTDHFFGDCLKFLVANKEAIYAMHQKNSGRWRSARATAITTARISARVSLVKANRRNYYRILHVQPEAPEEIVTATYRTIMSKLRLHPDLGGDHEAAVLVNQAYAVLSDRAKRDQYDRSLRQERTRTYPQTRGTVAARAPVTHPAMQPGCTFCQAGLPPTIQADTRCLRCESPLVPPPPQPAKKYDLFGRRSVPRVSKSDAVIVYPGWQMQACSARLRDLSTTGISVITDIALQANQVVRIVGPSFDVLASVISCRPGGRLFMVHARLVSAKFTKSTGVFVSIAA
jgi:hypothetical protein